jgi:hypothetical protein
MKGVLGMTDYRLRDFARVERWVDVALCTFLYLEDYRWRQWHRPHRTAKERLAWEVERTAGLCRAVRAAVEQGELMWVARRLHTLGGCRRLRRLVRANRSNGECRAG